MTKPRETNKKVTIADLVLVTNNQHTMIADCLKRITELEDKLSSLKTRDRGPKSTREMTDEDGMSIIYGEHKGLTHKEAAHKLGLSYGQVYSARSGYTFRHLEEKMKEEEKARKAAAK